MNKKLNIYLADLDHFAPGNRVSVPYSVASIKVIVTLFFQKKQKLGFSRILIN